MRALLANMAESLAILAKAAAPLTPSLAPDAIAYRWVRTAQGPTLVSVPHVHTIEVASLRNIDQQKNQLLQNTAQFVAGHPANHVLLTGARGCGKSSLVKAMLTAFAGQGLRMVEIEKQDLLDLPVLLDLLRAEPYRFILFCDDLTFQGEDHAYQALKTALDGGLTAPAANVKIYATSNRRHLLPEYHHDNITRLEDGELHLSESVDERIALSERFGLWLSFYAFDQTEYLHICESALAAAGLAWSESARRAALQWAQMRGARTGRVAQQFAQDWIGKQAMA